ncbi:MAG: DinB family protein [Cyclobacteriaceae bacterium]|nr:DinB family protein [Cyclobacteriaceae bacterium]
MKHLKLLSLGIALVLACGFRPLDGNLTDAERKAAIDYLKETKAKLLKDVKGLTAEQFNFKASPESWSVAECLEHIAFSESAIFGAVEGSLKEAANPDKRSEVKFSDDEIKGMISSRAQKVKTQEMFEPKNQFGDAAGSLKAFTAKRDANIEFIKSTKEDLRNHYATFPFGTMDSYQVLIFIAGHSARHTAQIEEVMSNANFPKKK